MEVGWAPEAEVPAEGVLVNMKVKGPDGGGVKHAGMELEEELEVIKGFKFRELRV